MRITTIPWCPSAAARRVPGRRRGRAAGRRPPRRRRRRRPRPRPTARPRRRRPRPCPWPAPTSTATSAPPRTRVATHSPHGRSRLIPHPIKGSFMLVRAAARRASHWARI